MTMETKDIAQLIVDYLRTYPEEFALLFATAAGNAANEHEPKTLHSDYLFSGSAKKCRQLRGYIEDVQKKLQQQNKQELINTLESCLNKIFNMSGWGKNSGLQYASINTIFMNIFIINIGYTMNPNLSIKNISDKCMDLRKRIIESPDQKKYISENQVTIANHISDLIASQKEYNEDIKNETTNNFLEVSQQFNSNQTDLNVMSKNENQVPQSHATNKNNIFSQNQPGKQLNNNKLNDLIDLNELNNNEKNDEKMIKKMI